MKFKKYRGWTLMNKTYLGDCLKVMKEIPDKSVDMILTDLPFGVTQNAWDSVISLSYGSSI
jgi:site-specific DNA-methyltransferase (adenine-specific)/modification methylase